MDTTVLPALPGICPPTVWFPTANGTSSGRPACRNSLPGFPRRWPPSTSARKPKWEFSTARRAMPRGDFQLSDPPDRHAAGRRFQKVTGAVAKRRGPLVAVVLAPPDPDYAENAALPGALPGPCDPGRVRSHAPRQHRRPGDKRLHSHWDTAGVLRWFRVSLWAAFRALRRRSRHGEEADAMITLHLEKPLLVAT